DRRNVLRSRAQPEHTADGVAWNEAQHQKDTHAHHQEDRDREQQSSDDEQQAGTHALDAAPFDAAAAPDCRERNSSALSAICANQTPSCSRMCWMTRSSIAMRWWRPMICGCIVKT